MEQEKKKINAVHERNLVVLLEKIGLFEKVTAGLVKCKFCTNLITPENIHSILPESGGFNLVCDKPECVNELMQYLNEKDLRKKNI